MSNFLYEVQQHNRLKQKGLLKRFSLDCEGMQATLESIRAEKNNKYYELDKKSKEYERWFLKYTPGKKRLDKIQKSSTRKKGRNNKKTKTRKNQSLQNVFDLYRNI